MQILACGAPPAPAEHATDADITAAVELLFLTRKGVSAQLVAVDTPEGIVVLNITQAIREALTHGPHAGFSGSSVRGRDGKAALYGRVGSQFEEEPAGTGASGSGGVAGPDSWVGGAARPGFDGFLARAPRPDADFALAERIRRRLFWSASLHRQGVAVRVERGCATLTGTVDTWLDREQAANDAYRAGARHTNNELRVAAKTDLRRPCLTPLPMKFPLGTTAPRRPRSVARRGEARADALRAERDADAAMSHNWLPDAAGPPAAEPADPEAATGRPPVRPGP